MSRRLASIAERRVLRRLDAAPAPDRDVKPDNAINLATLPLRCSVTLRPSYRGRL